MKNALNKLTLIILSLAMLWSCGKDDSPKEFDNFAPVIYDQSINLSGVLTGGQEVGLVKAYDSNMGTELSYTITINHNDLFQINETTGILSIKTDKQLDLNASPSQKITVSITDGEEEDDAQILICDCTPRFAQESYVFEMDEQISPVVIIHTFEVTDVDTEAEDLVFGIPTDDDGLFEINELGELSLASGESLDFETATEHSIVVSVTDGTETTEVDVLIKVLNSPDSLAENSDSFITTWQTDVDGETIYIGVSPYLSYDFTIDWGDGTVENLSFEEEGVITHDYEEANQYTVAISGDFPRIIMSVVNENVIAQSKEGYGLIGIKQWGNIQWNSMYGAFEGATTLEFYNATDTPDLSQGISTSYMFNGAVLFNADLSTWDIGNVVNMEGMFDNSGMSSENYGNTLIGWGNQVVVPNGITLGAEGLEYCGEQAVFARTLLVEAHNWNITGDTPCP